MKKRILCAILTVILLVSLVPATALTASAATNKISESAITILKQLQTYNSTCTAKGYVGYGTPCKEKGAHGSHKISQTAADKALRKELEDIDKAVNGFASANGLSLKQNQHDALALFSFRNGTPWISGTGDVKRAVTTRATGNDFLNMFCNWRSDAADNNRRLIEANMYLNGVYSSAVPDKYIKVTFNPNGGVMPGNGALTYYFDLSLGESVLPTPTRSGYTFYGWYNGYMGTTNGWYNQENFNVTENVPTNWVPKLNKACANQTLNAHWEPTLAAGTKFDEQDVKTVNYTLPDYLAGTKRVYSVPNGDPVSSVVSGNMYVDKEYVDTKGIKWGHIWYADKYVYTDPKGVQHPVEKYTADGYNGKTGQGFPAWWINLGRAETGDLGSSSDASMDITVTVTNSYVNSRVNASISSAKNGSYNQGTKLRIINTKQGSGFLWGQIAKSAEDNKPIGWVALMYTDYESIMAGKGNTGTGVNGSVIARARIKAPVNGYVHVRDGAGTDSNIVGSLTYQTVVDVYEIKYVNGFQWGRCDRGWFSLAYADVTRLVEEKNEITQTGFTSYAFSGKINDIDEIYTSPDASSSKVSVAQLIAEAEEAKKSYDAVYNGKTVTVTNITKDSNGGVWGKIYEGWILIYEKNAEEPTVKNFQMDTAKYEVVSETASVRATPNTSGARVDTLNKGVEFNVNKIYVEDSTLWGYADKVSGTYGGWVNLSSRYVKRNNAPIIATNNGSGSVSGTATVKGAEEVNVRSKASIHGGFVTKVKEGATYNIVDGPVKGWYRLSIPGYTDKETWVYQEYLTIQESGSVSSGSSSGTVETGKGIIANTYQGVNMRSSAGIGGTFMGKILPGIAVEINQVKQVGASKWGRLTINGKTGWICMDYVTMITYEQFPDANGNVGGNSSSSTVTGAQTAIYTGRAKANGSSMIEIDIDEFSETGDVTIHGRSKDSDNKLIVFKTTDINGPVVRVLNDGEGVTVHEILTVVEEYVVNKPDNNYYEDENGNYIAGDANEGSQQSVTKRTTYWARINDGYIKSPGNNLELDALDEAVYTLMDSGSLIAYNDELLSSEAAFTLRKGDQATITNVVVTGNRIAGKVEYVDTMGEVSGWIDLSKMSKGAQKVAEPTQATNPTNSQPVIGSNGNTGASGFVSNAGGYKYTGKVVSNTGELNVRSTPSTGADKTAVLKNGASLVIYETTIAEAMAWGRCDAGWVYLYYVDMTPASGSAIDARVVFNDNTIIYSDSSCSSTVGTYARMSVIDIYEEVGDMARTDQGWVKKSDLL